MLSIDAILVAPYLKYSFPPLSTIEKFVVVSVAAVVAEVAVAEFPVQAVAVAEFPEHEPEVVADAEVVAVVAVAAFPEILIPHVPDALELVIALPLSFCMACRILSVAATVPDPDT